MSDPSYDLVTVGRQLLEADLLTALVALDTYARGGVPKVLGPGSEPAEELRAVFDALRPADLSDPAAGVYARLRRQWSEGRPLERVRLPDWAMTYGLRVGFLARERAVRLLRIRTALHERTDALGAAADAEEALRTEAGSVR